MTKISLQDGKVVLRDGKIGSDSECCCGKCGPPCERCDAACLTATFSGFSGEVAGCDCADLNGTYTLKRGEGFQPYVRLSVQDDTGTGALVSATLGYKDEDGSYFIESVKVDNKGTCYSDDVTIVAKVFDGLIACNDPPTFGVTLGRVEPLLGLDVIDYDPPDDGTGAIFRPVYVPVVTTAGAETWAVDSVVVEEGGTGYDNLAQIAFTPAGCTVVVSPAVARVRVDSTVPVPDAVYIDTVGGSGATVSVTWEPATLPPVPEEGSLDGIPHWQPVVTASGGTGYSLLDNIMVTLSSEHFFYLINEPGDWIVASVTDVDQDGAITAVTTQPALYYRSLGTIESVEIIENGEYYTPGGVQSVTVKNKGTIWPDEACEYTICVERECGEQTKCREITLAIDSDAYRLAVRHDGTAIAEAEISSEDTPCDSMTFTSEDASGSGCVFGEVVIAAGECDTPPDEEACCIEDCAVVCESDEIKLWADGATCSPADPLCNDVQATLTCNLDNPNETFASELVPDPSPYKNSLVVSIAQLDSDTLNIGIFQNYGTGVMPLFVLPYTLVTRIAGVVVRYLDCKWYLIAAYDQLIRYVARAGPAGNLFADAGLSVFVSGAGGRYQGAIEIERRFCIADEGDEILVSMNQAGVSFGGQQLNWTNTAFDYVNGDIQDELPSLDRMYATPLSWVIRPRIGCFNPLP